MVRIRGPQVFYKIYMLATNFSKKDAIRAILIYMYVAI